MSRIPKKHTTKFSVPGQPIKGLGKWTKDEH